MTRFALGVTACLQWETTVPVLSRLPTTLAPLFLDHVSDYMIVDDSTIAL